jgi:hypothetical protein
MPKARTRKSKPIFINIDDDLLPDNGNVSCQPHDKIKFTAAGTPCVVVFKEFLLGISLCEYESVVVVVCDTDFVVHYNVLSATRLKPPKTENAPYRIQGGSGIEDRRKKK